MPWLLLAQQPGEYRWCERPAEIKPLEFITAVLRQKGKLFGRLDAFGDDMQLEAMGQSDDRFDNCFIIGVGPDIFNEGAVDLQYVDRELF